MRNYLNTLLEEKGIDQETILEVQGEEWGLNLIPVAAVVDYLVSCPRDIQAEVRKTLVNIDFHNGNVLGFFEHVAKFLAK